jgi:hypothetical protein
VTCRTMRSACCRCTRRRRSSASAAGGRGAAELSVSRFMAGCASSP